MASLPICIWLFETDVESHNRECELCVFSYYMLHISVFCICIFVYLFFICISCLLVEFVIGITVCNQVLFALFILVLKFCMVTNTNNDDDDDGDDDDDCNSNYSHY